MGKVMSPNQTGSTIIDPEVNFSEIFRKRKIILKTITIISIFAISYRDAFRPRDVNGPNAQFGFECIEKQLWRNKQNDLTITKATHDLIHHPWLNPDQRLKGNLHEQANADRNDRLDVSPNWRVGEKLVWLEGCG
ncbi:hypothetical protein AVEN_216704-1 [Araneus ventricosus]|uniref:Uncharacterized protein n=1 Tax=Araneus ventricosus TaxID=182803 RepID=A0A4Y2NFS6_ARAVE|nr:hypothetical protein AVEN_216704-1 [Araneus ventricosus]